MPSIVKIVVKRYIGYFDNPKFSRNNVTLTENSIAYEYIPEVESQLEFNLPPPMDPLSAFQFDHEMQSMKKWTYKTNSQFFKSMYQEIAERIQLLIESEIDEYALDIGPIEFIITYSDKSKVVRTYYVDSDRFKDLFACIKKLVPNMEQTPEVLLTSDDFDEEEDDD